MSDHTITITGKVGYKDKLSAKQAAQIIAFLNADEGDDPSLGASLGEERSGRRRVARSGGKVENAREAIELSGAKTNPEKIVALAAYVLEDGQAETFKTDQVKAQFQRAREALPKNFTRDLTNAITSNWIAEGDAGEYYLTSKVEGIFDGGFTFSKGATGAKPRAARARSTSPKKPKSPTTKPDVYSKFDVFPVTMDGFPPYSKMPSNKDKLMWVVMWAKKNGITGLTYKAIEWHTDYLGAGIPAKQLTAAFERARAPHGYVNKSTQDDTIRITDEGQAYLASLASVTK